MNEHLSHKDENIHSNHPRHSIHQKNTHEDYMPFVAAKNHRMNQIEVNMHVFYFGSLGHMLLSKVPKHSNLNNVSINVFN